MGRPKRIEIPEEVARRLAVKKIKDNIGHDLMGMYCDIHLDNRNVGYYNDDGWGGEAEINLSEADRGKILSILEAHQWRHRMFHEMGWDFYETEDKISDDTVIENLIEHLYDEKQKEKAFKKIEKQSEREILYGQWHSYTRSSFKGGMTLEQMVGVYGLAKVQDYIDRTIRPRLSEGSEILNTNFDRLGLRK